MAKTEITAEFGEKIGRAFGKYLGKSKKVVLGRDNRPKAEIVKEAVKKGLVGAGIKVEDLGILASPELSFHLVRLKAVGGIMITGSHLPIEYLGIVPMLEDGSGVFGKVGEEITKRFYE